MRRGLLINFEGVDGTGKSTQIRLLARWLREQEVEPLILREPGGTELAEEIRTLLLARREESMDALTELLLYEASRAQLVATKIRPALEQDRLVLLDRYYDSTLAYQGYGRGLDREFIDHVHRVIARNAMPDLTILLDLDLKDAAGRRRGRPDRMEQEAEAFFERVRGGFLQLAQDSRWLRIDASGEIGQIQGVVRAEVWKKWNER